MEIVAATGSPVSEEPGRPLPHRPFRFATVVAGRASTYPEWPDYVREVERLGYSTLLMTDHVDGQYAPGPALGMAAAISDRLTFGSLVVCNDFYRPALLAREAATLHRLTGGRYELGLGAGWNPNDYACAGVVKDPASQRIARLEESVQIVRACFAGEPFAHVGEHYQMSAAAPVVPSVAPGGPRLVMGGGGPRMLRAAGRCADVVSLNPQLTDGYQPMHFLRPPEPGRNMDDKLAWVADGAGDRFRDLELSLTIYAAFITDKPGRIARLLARRVGCDTASVLASPHVLIGTIDDMIKTLQERRERWGISYLVIDHLYRHAMQPLVRELSGT